MTDQDPTQPCDLGAEPLDDDITGPDRDLLGQHAPKWRLLAATTLHPAQEYL
ncbi:MAG: hypothetical protein HOZ81_05065 [Streptomyces sp.]|nr:hypothetical protein [Streptomyces sp.]